MPPPDKLRYDEVKKYSYFEPGVGEWRTDIFRWGAYRSDLYFVGAAGYSRDEASRQKLLFDQSGPKYNLECVYASYGERLFFLTLGMFIDGASSNNRDMGPWSNFAGRGGTLGSMCRNDLNRCQFEIPH